MTIRFILKRESIVRQMVRSIEKYTICLLLTLSRFLVGQQLLNFSVNKLQSDHLIFQCIEEYIDFVMICCTRI